MTLEHEAAVTASEPGTGVAALGLGSIVRRDVIHTASQPIKKARVQRLVFRGDAEFRQIFFCLTIVSGQPWGIQMIKTILGAAILSTVFLSVPASARVSGCDAVSLTKAGSALEVMADGPGRAALAMEVAAVNDAISKGDMHACAVHIRKAEHLEAM